MKYRKKPIVIEAIQFNDVDSGNEIAAWSDKKIFHRYYHKNGNIDYKTYHLVIPTLEGEMTASQGDWIIKGVNGEFYPCKNDIFQKIYEKVEEC